MNAVELLRKAQKICYIQKCCCVECPMKQYTGAGDGTDYTCLCAGTSFDIPDLEAAVDFVENYVIGTDPKYIQRQGECPHCASVNVTYGYMEIANEGLFYLCRCDDCKTDYREWYDVIFSESEIVESEEEK